MAWLAASGTDGVCPNGSLGEYQTLTDEERARVVQTAAEARPAGFGLMPGVAAYGSRQTQRWIEQAAEAGAESVLLLPPNTYRADSETVLDHYRAAAAVGLPIVAYNNPIDTKVDLTPDVLAQLFDEDLIVAVKEFTGDVRRAWEIAELAPGLDLLSAVTTWSSSSAWPAPSAGSAATPTPCPGRASSCSRPPPPATRPTSPRRCRSTATSTRCSAGTRRPSSSRPSS